MFEGEAEKKVLSAQEKEQTATTSLADVKVKFNHLESQVSNLTKEKHKLETFLSAAQRDLQAAQNSQAR